MGLPHVVVRFYTNPDGRAARRTTLVVLVLLGVFYLLPPVYGALGRIYAPELATRGRSDALVLELPRLMVAGLLGEVLTGLVTAGRVRGVPVDVVGAGDRGRGRAQPGRHRPDLGGAPARRGRRPSGSARWSRSSVPCVVALAVPNLGVARAVGLAFAMAAVDVLPAAAARASGGAGSPTPARSPGCWSAGSARAVAVAWTVGVAGPSRLGRRAAGPAGRLDACRSRSPRWSLVSLLTRAPVPAAHRPVPGAPAHAGDPGAGPGLSAGLGGALRRTAAPRPAPASAARPGRRRRRCGPITSATTVAPAASDSRRARSAKNPGARRYGDTASPGRTTSAGRRPSPSGSPPRPGAPHSRPSSSAARTRSRVASGSRGAGGHQDQPGRARPGAGLDQPGDLRLGQQVVRTERATHRDRAGSRPTPTSAAGPGAGGSRSRAAGVRRRSARTSSSTTSAKDGSHSSTYDATAGIPSRSPAAAVIVARDRVAGDLAGAVGDRDEPGHARHRQPVAALDDGLHGRGCRARRAAGRPPSRRRARSRRCRRAASRAAPAATPRCRGWRPAPGAPRPGPGVSLTSAPSRSTSSPCSSSWCAGRQLDAEPGAARRQLGLELLDHRGQPGPLGVDRRHAPHLEGGRGDRADAGGDHVGLEGRRPRRRGDRSGRRHPSARRPPARR